MDFNCIIGEPEEPILLSNKVNESKFRNPFKKTLISRSRCPNSKSQRRPRKICEIGNIKSRESFSNYLL